MMERNVVLGFGESDPNMIFLDPNFEVCDDRNANLGVMKSWASLGLSRPVLVD